MNSTPIWTRVLLVAGLAAMVIGLIDPLEGWLVILVGTVTVALGAYFGESRYRVLSYFSVILVALGGVAMIGFSVIGGIGGDTGRSMWWGLFILPYPAGWIMGVVGAILAITELFGVVPPGRSGESSAARVACLRISSSSRSAL